MNAVKNPFIGPVGRVARPLRAHVSSRAIRAVRNPQSASFAALVPALEIRAYTSSFGSRSAFFEDNLQNELYGTSKRALFKMGEHTLSFECFRFIDDSRMVISVDVAQCAKAKVEPLAVVKKALRALQLDDRECIFVHTPAQVRYWELLDPLEAARSF